MKKVVLAYSGGLDTSIIIPWLKETYGYEVIAMAADLGQGEELAPLQEKAIKSGASKLYIEDLREEFLTEFIFPTLKAGAVYEGSYLLGTSFARPLIARRLVEIAAKEGAVAIAHGATGKGNDQVRFELSVKALNPDLEIIAPWRIWDLKSREDCIDYAQARGIPVPVTKDRPYSMDRNLWHLSHEGGDLEDPWNEPKRDLYLLGVSPEDAPDEATYLELGFEQGVPTSLNGQKIAPVALLETLNELGGKNGVGIVDMVENRLVGMKSRGVYETPGGTILYMAHQALERLTLDRLTLHYKEQIALKYAEIVYDGVWYSPLREALDAFVNVTQKNATGTVRVKLYKGNCTLAGVKSPYSLYNEAYATFGEDGVYDQKDAGGFINLFGLPLKVRALMEKESGLRK
ncbi:argininosuccinate synthase [Desulfosporosinus nitroreducens]|uniref:Argininosuccinate synthase n=1 Tax=Desulfosporosinus nitroreducens TaxID=2018668 RepID=A0ABT8QSF6_9FIRM|nr:argininosuccinate synthase [Desulfosporosinus nitroreducens]MCO1602703.1 argininosuccinate synthase [Desulfosporosinus nitroreducens]MCO5388134.1 argininosuccinate synthase [Desulfosporosinus sp.]MDO0823590.1 argininosuccinate synthase [Desulfosporosinus nitroreducens]